MLNCSFICPNMAQLTFLIYFLYYCVMLLFVLPYLWHGAYYYLIEAQKQHLTNYIISSQPYSSGDILCCLRNNFRSFLRQILIWWYVRTEELWIYMTSACVVDIFIIQFCCMAEISSFYHLCKISWDIICFVLYIYVLICFLTFLVLTIIIQFHPSD
jgi:hypothetical protein